MSEQNETRETESNIERLLARAHEPPEMRAEARARIKETLLARGVVGKRRALPRLTRGRLFVALALAAGVVLWIALASRGGGEASRLSHANTGHAPMRVELADGSSAVLDQGCELDETGYRQATLVRGQALLDVVHGKGPFVVDAPDGRVVVTGTRFVVASSEEGTLAAVARGEVRLEGDSTVEVLHAGEEGTVKRGARPTRRPAPRLSHLSSFAREALAANANETASCPERDARGAQPQWGQKWPLAIRDFSVDVYVEDGVARTTIDQTFFNHVNAQLEGVYSFPLPPGAAISRLAMYVDGKLVEGGVVERHEVGTSTSRSCTRDATRRSSSGWPATSSNPHLPARSAHGEAHHPLVHADAGAPLRHDAHRGSHPRGRPPRQSPALQGARQRGQDYEVVSTGRRSPRRRTAKTRCSPWPRSTCASGTTSS